MKVTTWKCSDSGWGWDLGPTSGGSATALITSRAPWSTEEYATEHNELSDYFNNDAMYNVLVIFHYVENDSIAVKRETPLQ